MREVLTFSMLMWFVFLISSIVPQVSTEELTNECGGCQNGGICKQDENENNEAIMVCKCPKPYRGYHCEVSICNNGHQCQNGAGCAFNEETLEYKCDCSSTTSTQYSYAGLTCEHESTDSCVYDKTMSKITFCTNGGICKQHVEGETEHKGCICSEEFEGPHCEYLKGTAPSLVYEAHPDDAQDYLFNDYIEDTKNNQMHKNIGEEHDISDVVVFTVAICVLGLLSSIVVIYHRKSTVVFDKVETRDRSELNLDPDGGRLPDIHLDEDDAKLDGCNGELT